MDKEIPRPTGLHHDRRGNGKYWHARRYGFYNILSTPIKQSEGSYWGFDMAVNGDEIVLAGYHRDIMTAGSWNDITNIFMIHSSNAKSSLGWTTKMNVLNDIDIRPQDGDSIAVGIGQEEITLVSSLQRRCNRISELDYSTHMEQYRRLRLPSRHLLAMMQACLN